MPVSPGTITNPVMDGTFIAIPIGEQFNSIMLKMRDIAEPFQVSFVVGGATFVTINPGNSFEFGSRNFRAGEEVYVNAANTKILEVTAFERG